MSAALEDATPSLADPALVFADPKGVIRMWSAGAERTFGHAASAAVGSRSI